MRCHCERSGAIQSCLPHVQRRVGVAGSLRRCAPRDDGHRRGANIMKRIAAAFLMLAVSAFPGFAQSWPPKLVHVIVPFGAGSTPDIVARLLADGLGKSHSEASFIVENKPGASGNIGTDAVAKATPDGSVIGLSIGGPLAINTLLFSHLPYDPKKDIAPITQLIT